MSFPRKVLININSEELNIMYLFKYIISIIINTCLVIGNVFCLGLKIISFVFLTLMDNLLAFSQVETLWSWSLRWEVFEFIRARTGREIIDVNNKKEGA